MAGPIYYIFLVVLAIVWIGLVSAVIKMYQKAKQGEALVRSGMGGTKVSFSGMFVTPILHHLERLDITVKSYEVSKRKDDALLTNDGRELEIEVLFYLRINQTEDDVKQVAQTFGSEDVSSSQFIERNFGKKFEEAVLTLVYGSDLNDLLTKMDDLKMEIINTVGDDLNGFVLDDLAIHHLKELEKSNITQP